MIAWTSLMWHLTPQDVELVANVVEAALMHKNCWTLNWYRSVKFVFAPPFPLLSSAEKHQPLHTHPYYFCMSVFDSPEVKKSFHPAGQRDAEANGTTGGSPQTDAGETRSTSCFPPGWLLEATWTLLTVNVGFRSVPSALPKCLQTPSWRWMKSLIWASSSPTWWTWSTPGPTGPRLLKSARWRTSSRVRSEC